MTLLKRFGYYLGGFSIGLILLAFFLSGKKTSCDYSPSARVKKNIRIKKRVFSDEVKSLLNTKTIDTTAISYIINKGDVSFSESNTKLDSCKIYVINGSYNQNDLKLTIENCDSIATIKDIDIKNKAQ